MPRWASGAVVLALVAAICLARTANLGASEFWFDEYFHVFAAQALSRTGQPTLPSGEVYGRGLEITRLVAVAQRHVADPELAARLPSAIFGIANVLIFTAIAWKVGGPWVALWAALLLGTYPGAVLEARNTRFYTEQLNLALIAFWFGWSSVREGPRANAGKLIATWGQIAGAAFAFGAAAQIQLTTWSVALAYAIILAGAATIDLRVLGRQALRTSARVQVLLVGIVGLICALAFRLSTITAMVRFAVFVPAWAQGQFAPQAYYWMLSEWLPLMLALLPAVYLVAATRHARLAAYLAIWFGVPLLLHSVVFRFQADRYVLPAMPGLLLAAAVAATVVCGVGYAGLRRLMARYGLAGRASAITAAACVAACAMVATVTSPAFTLTRKHATGVVARTATNWRGTGDVIRRIAGSDSIPWGTSNPLASLFYMGRADFSIYDAEIERPIGPDGQRAGVSDATADHYSGVTIISDPDAIRARFASKGAVLVAIDSAFYAESWAMPVFTTLRREALEVCERRCGPMRIYYWRFDRPASSGEIAPLLAPAASLTPAAPPASPAAADPR